MSDTDSIPQVQRIATDLRAIADLFDAMSPIDLPKLSYVKLAILPESTAPEPARVAAVDVIASYILGKTAIQAAFYQVDGQVGTVAVSAHTRSAPPQSELDRLRAELAEAREQLAQAQAVQA